LRLRLPACVFAADPYCSAGPGTRELPANSEWSTLPHQLRQAVSQALARRRQEDADADGRGSPGGCGAPASRTFAAASGVGGGRGRGTAQGDVASGGSKGGVLEEIEELLEDFQAAMARIPRV
jgi:hypothetical protein